MTLPIYFSNDIHLNNTGSSSSGPINYSPLPLAAILSLLIACYVILVLIGKHIVFLFFILFLLGVLINLSFACSYIKLN